MEFNYMKRCLNLIIKEILGLSEKIYNLSIKYLIIFENKKIFNDY